MDNYQRTMFTKTMNLIVASSTVVLINELKKNERKRPICRINRYLIERNKKGRFVTDFNDMMNNAMTFQENFHMSFQLFNSLFEILKPHLMLKRNSWGDLAISPKHKLAVVLEYFASGDLQRHLASCYRISKQHLGHIIDLVCDAICLELKPRMPELNRKKFTEISNGFNENWNFPNCIGAIDGKHVALQAPKNSGSLFFNYKGFHSLVIMAVCDSSYKFTYLDIGAHGSEGDANVFKNSKFGEDVVFDRQDFPLNTTVNGVKLPFFYVADDAFPLCKRILKPYGSKQKLTDDEIIFNYRLSRARRCIENSFGILCCKWQCLKRTMFCNPDRAQKIISACCLLHNFLITCDKRTYYPPSYEDRLDNDGNIIEGEWRKRISSQGESMFHSSIPSHLGRSTDYGKFVRDTIKSYVNSRVGAVPWQKRAAFIE